MNDGTATVRFVYFDLDDTLIDTTSAVRAGFRDALDSLRREVAAAGLTPPSAAFEEKLFGVFGSSFAPEYLAAWLYQAGVADGFRQRLADEGTAAFRAAVATIKPYPEAADVLARLAAAGVGCGVITDGRTQRQEEKIARSGLARWLGPVFISGNYPPFSDKPSQTMFRDGLAACGAPAGEVMFVGDRVKDVIGANLAGMISVRVRQGWAAAEEVPADLAAAAPQFDIRHLGELPDLIRPADEKA